MVVCVLDDTSVSIAVGVMECNKELVGELSMLESEIKQTMIDSNDHLKELQALSKSRGRSLDDVGEYLKKSIECMEKANKDMFSTCELLDEVIEALKVVKVPKIDFVEVPKVVVDQEPIDNPLDIGLIKIK